ncbi:MAG: hypothetical protein JNJ85_16875 [Candidatus Kapabacteria bacterium]|nr:hypothetical protein [Candidatus Kapabacteria bacterium]MBX7154764.1 hypothetical protein [Bacteroidota bacterium]
MKNKTNIRKYMLLFLSCLFVLVIGCNNDTNSTGTTGNVEGIPVVTTLDVSNIGKYYATCGGEITSTGTAIVYARGVCWSTSSTPTISDNKTTDENRLGISKGDFTSVISGLAPNTKYYFRCFATNAKGTGYGNVMSFTTRQISTNNSFTDPRDGKVYETVTIGTQVWMAENLAYLPSVVPSGTGSDTIPYYYVYDYNGTNVKEAKESLNYSVYGVLYNWKAATISCPPGWHLPTNAEWQQLDNFLGGVGGKLKQTGTALWKSPNTGATNESGFSALPGGYRVKQDDWFFDMGNNCYFWSASEQNQYYAFYNQLNYSLGGFITASKEVKEMGYSVRCIKD